MSIKMIIASPISNCRIVPHRKDGHALISISVSALLLLGGCSTSGPATIERNENVYYRYDDTLQIETMNQGESLQYVASKYGANQDELARINSLPRGFVASSSTDILLPTHKSSSASGSSYSGNRQGVTIDRDDAPTSRSGYVSSDQYYGDSIQAEPIDKESRGSGDSSDMYLADQRTQREKSYGRAEEMQGEDNSARPGKKSTIHPIELEIKSETNQGDKQSKIAKKDVKNDKNNAETAKTIAKTTPAKMNEQESGAIDINSLDKTHHESDAHDTSQAEVSSDKQNEEEKDNIDVAEAEASKAGAGFKISNPMGMSRFMWPLQGKILQRFDKSRGSEGINVAVPANTIVRAAADGKVIYVGSNINQYGNLLIIRHDGDYLSAYAHSSQVMVKKGQQIRKGQAVAKVGQSGGVNEPQLYFSIRHGKEIIDPEVSRAS